MDDLEYKLLMRSGWFRELISSALFLTFDDGPNPEVTPALLDLLDRYEAKATFFVIGEALDSIRAQEILKNIIKRGHTVGNHGLLHSRNVCPRFDQMREIIANICKVDTRIIRAPYGSRALLKRYLTHEPDALSFHWAHAFNDWLPLDYRRITRRLPRIIQPGRILLLHDGIAPGAAYRDRQQVLSLVEIICRLCTNRGIPIQGIAHIFPSHHQQL